MFPCARIAAPLRALGAGLPRPFWFLWVGTFITRPGTFVLPFLALHGAGAAVAGALGGFLADRFGRRIHDAARVDRGWLEHDRAGLGPSGGVDHRDPLLVALMTEMYRTAM